MLSRSCYWYNLGSNPEEQIQTFIDILGKDWEMSRICGGLSSSLSFLFFCYLLSFTCSSQTRGVRYFNTVFLCVVLTALQGLTFLTFYSNNDFCEEYICTFSRSAGFSVVSMGCFFLSGLCFCCTHDYPGPRWKKKKSSFLSSSPLKARQQQIAPDSRDVLAPGVTTKSKVATAMGEESKNEEVGYRNFGGNPDDGLRTNNESNNIPSGAPAYYTTGAYRNDSSDGSGGGSGNHENVTRSTNEFNINSFEEIEEEVIEDKYEEGSVATGGTSVADNKNRQINDDDFNTLVGLKAGDSREVVTEVTNDEVKIVEAITHADGTKTVTKTTEEIAEDGYQREGEIKIDDDFVAHPGLGAGDDCEVITEVTEDEIKVVETIRHADGSQTVTETHEELSDEKVWI
jgi:hypothetical protein